MLDRPLSHDGVTQPKPSTAPPPSMQTIDDSTGSVAGASSVQVDLRVGLVDLTLAKMLTKGHHIIEFPTLLLPEDVKPGSIVRLTCERDFEKESTDNDKFVSTQRRILVKYAQDTPQRPVLHAMNVTQTTAVLKWDPIKIATADLRSLTLYKDGERVGVVPEPLHRTSTKLTSLEIDQKCQFQLVLSTSAGDFASDPVLVHTHKMTDLTGVTVCVGSLRDSTISQEDLEQAVEHMGANPLQSRIKLDTTHFICTTEEGEQCKRARDLNIPVVRPEWLKACEMEKRLVSVAAYYISADPSRIPEPIRNSGTKKPKPVEDHHGITTSKTAPGTSSQTSLAADASADAQASETAEERAQDEEDAKARQPLADSAAEAPETKEEIEERAEADAQAEAAKTYETKPDATVDAEVEDQEVPAEQLPNPTTGNEDEESVPIAPLSEEARQEPYVGADLGAVPDLAEEEVVVDVAEPASEPLEAAEAIEAANTVDALEADETEHNATATESAETEEKSEADLPSASETTLIAETTEAAEPAAETTDEPEPESEAQSQPQAEAELVAEPTGEAEAAGETETAVEAETAGENETSGETEVAGESEATKETEAASETPAEEAEEANAKTPEPETEASADANVSTEGNDTPSKKKKKNQKKKKKN